MQKQGFSLVEVMVALVIMGTVTMSLSYLIYSYRFFALNSIIESVAWDMISNKIAENNISPQRNIFSTEKLQLDKNVYGIDLKVKLWKDDDQLEIVNYEFDYNIDKTSQTKSGALNL